MCAFWSKYLHQTNNTKINQINLNRVSSLAKCIPQWLSHCLHALYLWLKLFSYDLSEFNYLRVLFWWTVRSVKFCLYPLYCLHACSGLHKIEPWSKCIYESKVHVLEFGPEHNKAKAFKVLAKLSLTLSFRIILC